MYGTPKTQWLVGAWLFLTVPGCIAVDDPYPIPNDQHQAPDTAAPTAPRPTPAALAEESRVDCEDVELDPRTDRAISNGGSPLPFRACDMEGAECCGGEICTSLMDGLYCLHTM